MLPSINKVDYYYYYYYYVINANSIDPDQRPHLAASDLGLHVLPMSFLWDARHKWVMKNYSYQSPFLSTKQGS